MKLLKVLSGGALATSAVLCLELGCGSLLVPHATAVLTTNAASGIVATNYVTNYTVAPGVTTTLGRAQSITEKIPGPWAEIATTVLGLATGILAWIAKVKSDRAALVPALIAGVEAAKNNEEVKTSIKKIAEQTGLEKRLNRVVRRVKSAKAKMDFGKTP